MLPVVMSHAGYVDGLPVKEKSVSRDALPESLVCDCRATTGSLDERRSLREDMPTVTARSSATSWRRHHEEPGGWMSAAFVCFAFAWTHLPVRQAA